MCRFPLVISLLRCAHKLAALSNFRPPASLFVRSVPREKPRAEGKQGGRRDSKGGLNPERRGEKGSRRAHGTLKNPQATGSPRISKFSPERFSSEQGAPSMDVTAARTAELTVRQSCPCGSSSPPVPYASEASREFPTGSLLRQGADSDRLQRGRPVRLQIAPSHAPGAR